MEKVYGEDEVMTLVLEAFELGVQYTEKHGAAGAMANLVDAYDSIRAKLA